ncbi:MAG: lipid-A-disaccharide synthase-related protein [Firmicutes bacterium]|nr:lipid-A-disaccharide synthase-related protein [Bacillota bacterium]
MKNSEVKILFLSNGYGEDAIASGIVEKILEKFPGLKIFALPLVGDGKAYKSSDISIIGPSADMPSKGLIPANWKNIFKDMAAGLGSLLFKQIKTIKKIRREISCVVAVGDLFPVVMAGLFAGRPLVFVGTAKSNYYYPYSPVEVKLLKKFCRVALVRDETTAESLRKESLDARWVGNAMMDCMRITGKDFGIPASSKVIGLLPGSRDEAYADFQLILKSVEHLDDENFSFIAALADSTSIEKIAEESAMDGWEFDSGNNLNSGNCGLLKKSGKSILLTKGCFGDVISKSVIVIGQAGTGNEQAAGLGKPVVSFDSEGKKNPGWYRARQKGLLGDSLSVVEKNYESIFLEVKKILDNPQVYEKMKNTGLQRMGPAGGAGKMAQIIMKEAGVEI